MSGLAAIQEIEFREGDVRKRLFPADIDPGQVIEIVSELGKADSGVELTDLEKTLDINSVELACLVNATQLLSLTRIHDGRIWISKQGIELNSCTDIEKKKQLLNEGLRLVEPFTTALKLAKNEKIFSSDEVADLLSQEDLMWAEDQEINEILVHRMLIDWLLFTGLLKIDEETNMFSMEVSFA